MFTSSVNLTLETAPPFWLGLVQLWVCIYVSDANEPFQKDHWLLSDVGVKPFFFFLFSSPLLQRALFYFFFFSFCSDWAVQRVFIRTSWFWLPTCVPPAGSQKLCGKWQISCLLRPSRSQAVFHRSDTRKTFSHKRKSSFDVSVFLLFNEAIQKERSNRFCFWFLWVTPYVTTSHLPLKIHGSHASRFS